MAGKRERSARKGSRERTEGAEAGGSSGGRPAHVVWAVVSAVVLVVFAPGLFVAGFFTNELVSDDGGGTTVAQPSPSAGTPSAPTTPTPPPVVAASADDDPFIGPADAPVTIIEFSDYQ